MCVRERETLWLKREHALDLAGPSHRRRRGLISFMESGIAWLMNLYPFSAWTGICPHRGLLEENA